MATTGTVTKTYGSLERPELSTHSLMVQCGTARFIAGNNAGRTLCSIDCQFASGKILFVRAQYLVCGGKEASGALLYCSGTVKARSVMIRRATAGGHVTSAMSTFWYEIVGY